MRILLTGASGGIGKEIAKLLDHDHELLAPTRQDLDLACSQSVTAYAQDISVDMLINCAGTGIGGKIDFARHDIKDIDTIMRTNLVGVMLLTRCVLAGNPGTKIVNITSTNNRRYYPDDLAYSLTKQALSLFGEMLRIDYPDLQVLEIRVGLTRTGFNVNRYAKEPDRYQDIYHHKHLMPDIVAAKIFDNLFDPCVKFVEIAP
jgi:short-subunit dehydrogenase